MEPVVLWQHKWSQDLFVPGYLFLGGLAAGTVITAVLADLIALVKPRAEALSRVAAIVAVPVIGVAGIVLTVHLGKPERGLGFPLFFTNYNSWMTRGGWVFGAAAPLIVLYAALWYLRVLPQLRRSIGVVLLPLSVFLAMYTGFLLSGAGYVPLWSRHFLPTLFLSSGLTAGVSLAGLAFLVAGWLSLTPSDDPSWVRRVLGLALVLLIAFELYELRAFTRYLSISAPDKAQAEVTPSGEYADPMGSRLAYRYLTGGPEYPRRFVGALTGEAIASADEEEAREPRGPARSLAPWFWIGVIGLGLCLPLLLGAVEFVIDPVSRRTAHVLAAVKFCLVLGGGFLLRVVIVWGGDLKAPLPFPPSMWQVPGL
jgi:polysulfide reductase chain C